MGKIVCESVVDAEGALNALDAHDRMDERIDHARAGHLDAHRARDAAVGQRGEVDRADVEFQVAADDFGDVVGHAGRVGSRSGGS